MNRDTIGALGRASSFILACLIICFVLLALEAGMSLVAAQKDSRDIYSKIGSQIYAVMKDSDYLEEAFHEYMEEKEEGYKQKIISHYDQLKHDYNEIEKDIIKNENSKIFNYENYKVLITNLGQSIDDVSAQIKKIESGEKLSDKNFKSLYLNIEGINSEIHKLQNFYNQQFIGSTLTENLKNNEYWLYGSIILLAAFALILLVLNAHKMKKLEFNNKEKHETLSLLEKRLAAMEASRDGIMIIDGHKNLSYMNKALCSVLSLNSEMREKYYGQLWKNIFHPSDLYFLDETIIPELEEQGYWQGEYALTNQNLGAVHAEISMTLLQGGGVVGTIQNVSERHKAHNEKKQLEEQFYQAQKMEAIGRLAGGIAHDFNNILAAMNGYAEFLVDDLAPESQQHQFAKNILQAGRQARGLVDQMLAFSRRSDNAFDVFDLTDPIKETLSMVQSSFPKTIEVQGFVNMPFAPIKGNPTQMTQILMNLCVNARDAMEGNDDHGSLMIRLDEYKVGPYFNIVGVLTEGFPEKGATPLMRIDDVGPGRTQLVLGSLVKGKHYAKLSVQDCGTGMSRSVLERIFEPFFTTKPVDKGTGLGLATVHGVVVTHNGFMIIDTTIGQGTVFELFLPLDEENFSKQKQKNKMEEEKVFQKSESNENDIRLLLVEDQKNVQDMMVSMLERMGYDVFVCNDGLEGLGLLRDEPETFDVVISDHNMPNMTGLEMIQQVSLFAPDLPFILLSGYSEQELHDIMGAHKAIKAIMRKPAQKDVLKAKIEEILDESKKEKPAAA